MIKKIICTLVLLSLNVGAVEENNIPDYEGSTYFESYKKLMNTFGIVKSVPNKLSDAKSIQELYLSKDGVNQFNYHTINYFLKLNENLKGFSPKGQLIYKVSELNKLYRDYVTNPNLVKRQIIENQYKEILKQKSQLLDYSLLQNKIYYSSVPILGTYKFDFNNLEKKIIFDTQRINYPAVYLNCFKNGEMIGVFYANGYTDNEDYLPTHANKTPIVLKFPKEISEKFEYSEKNFEENMEYNLCSHKQKFEDLSNAEVYENLLSDNRNQFFVFFNIDTNYKDNNYLVGNVSHMGLFSYDSSDSMHMPYFIWEGKNYSTEKVETIIKNNIIKNNEIKKGFNSNFLKNNYTYVFYNENDEYFMQGLNNGSRARLVLNKTNLFAEYNIVYFEDYLELTLDKLIKDSPNNFPIKMIISKNNSKNISSTLSLYAQLIDRPHYFKELNLDLKQGFLFDWKKNIEEK